MLNVISNVNFEDSEQSESNISQQEIDNSNDIKDLKQNQSQDFKEIDNQIKTGDHKSEDSNDSGNDEMYENDQIQKDKKMIDNIENSSNDQNSEDLYSSSEQDEQNNEQKDEKDILPQAQSNISNIKNQYQFNMQASKLLKELNKIKYNLIKDPKFLDIDSLKTFLQSK